jgi:hypothetical protein
LQDTTIGGFETSLMSISLLSIFWILDFVGYLNHSDGVLLYIPIPSYLELSVHDLLAAKSSSHLARSPSC